ncbi:MAG: winged helix DNA-binding domain-containing protein [Sideroxydans sp.]|nr:winged helix DNA-binding domain-containing protein [Sideroxydans sp.]
MHMNIAQLRLHNQHIAKTHFVQPEQVISHFGGMQGQDFPGVKWSIGLRLPQTTDVHIRRVFDERKIVRTWPMRGTLHVVAAADVRWILQLTSPKNIKGSLRRRDQLELDDKTLTKSREVITKALQGGKQLSRDEVYAALNAARISTEGQRGYHLLWSAALHGLICFAATTDAEQNLALLEEWVAPAKSKTRDEALAELALRYFSSRGPATLKDFIWWSGLSAAEARAGLEAIKSHLVQETVNALTYWMPFEIDLHQDVTNAFSLPGFDEYLLGYQDRSAVLANEHAAKICPGGNGVFFPTMVIDGRVVGTWKRAIKKNSVVITVDPFAKLNKPALSAFKQAAYRYAMFMGLPMVLD